MTINRRTVVRGTAWAVPALTIASAAPAVSASCDPAKNITERTIRYEIRKTPSTDTVPIDGTPQDVDRMTYVVTNLGPEAAPKGAKLSVTVHAGVPEGMTLHVLSDTTTDIRQTSADPANTQYVLTYTVPYELAAGQSYSYDVETAFTGDPVGDAYSSATLSSTPVANQQIVEQCETVLVSWDDQS